MTVPAAPAVLRGARPLVVTGGCGFIGSNLSDSLMCAGHDVVIIDNLCRAGVERNLEWLRRRHRHRLQLIEADVRDENAIAPAVAQAAGVYHLAGQTAVTTSLADPLEDFEANARGTLNVLEAVRKGGRKTPVIFASTNKVYGALGDLPLTQENASCRPADERLARHGISEERGLDFCTPYGCSKGVADQYVLDYARSFGIPTAVLRMSCVYGPRQQGTEDQGWVAHFLIRALEGRKITIFGDGRQVRDVLQVGDAVRAYRTVFEAIESVSGQVFNLGGGPANAVSLLQVVSEIGRITGNEPDVEFAPWRMGDQHWFVADTTRLERRLGWKPATGWRAGLRDLARWLEEENGAGRQDRRALA
jgi:CDP-paratose 2-epimerase